MASIVLSASSHEGMNNLSTPSFLSLFFCWSDWNDVVSEVDERLDGGPCLQLEIEISWWAALIAPCRSRQQLNQPYNDRAVHVAWAIFIACGTGTLNSVTYDEFKLAWKNKNKIDNDTAEHTSLNALSFGSSGSNSFIGRPRALPSSWELNCGGGLLILQKQNEYRQREDVWT